MSKNKGVLHPCTTSLYHRGTSSHPNTPELESALRQASSLESGTRATHLHQFSPLQAILSSDSPLPLLQLTSTAIRSCFGREPVAGAIRIILMPSLEFNAGARGSDDPGLEGSNTSMQRW